MSTTTNLHSATAPTCQIDTIQALVLLQEQLISSNEFETYALLTVTSITTTFQVQSELILMSQTSRGGTGVRTVFMTIILCFFRRLAFFRSSFFTVIIIFCFYSCFRAPVLECHHQGDWAFSKTGEEQEV